MRARPQVLLCLFSIMLSNPGQISAKNCDNDSPIDFFSDKALVADYVIIGAGTAGATLAKKLSNDNTTSVIALHNGENLTQDPQIKYTKNVLTTVLSTLTGPPLSITGKTTRQEFANNRREDWIVGLPLGGVSSVNAGAYCRGTNQVYSQWEAIAGPKWSVNRILDVYKSLEDYIGQTTDPSARGYHGPLNVRQNNAPTNISNTFTAAIIAGTGFPFVLDYNDPNTPIGASSQVQYTQKGNNGRLRVSSSTAFLDKNVMTPEGLGVNGRKLRVLFNAIALRTIWEGNKAVGVEFMQDGVKPQKVIAKKRGHCIRRAIQQSVFTALRDWTQKPSRISRHSCHL